MNLFKSRNTNLTDEEKQKKFYKKLRIRKNTSESDIQQKILKYLAKNKKLDLVYLTEKQQSDTIFMISLYKTNPSIYNYYKPTLELQENAFYMKTCINNLVESMVALGEDKTIALINSLKGLDVAFNDISFVKMLIDSHADQNMIEILHSALVSSNKDQVGYKTFVKILDELPKEHFEKLVRHVGVDVISLLPESHKYYVDLASLAVSKQCFTAIKALSPEFVANNIDLLYYATKSTNLADLFQYLKFDLTKDKVKGKEKEKALKETKRKIVNNPKIKELLLNEFYVTNHMVDSLENI